MRHIGDNDQLASKQDDGSNEPRDHYDKSPSSKLTADRPLCSSETRLIVLSIFT